MTKAESHEQKARWHFEQAEALECQGDGCEMGSGSLHLAHADAQHAHERAAKLYRAEDEDAGAFGWRANACSRRAAELAQFAAPVDES